MKLDTALVGISRLGIDAAPVIYFIEVHPRYDPLVSAVFQRVSDGVLTGVTSVITLTEVLVHPLARGNLALARQYRTLLRRSRQIRMIPVDPAVAEHAAELRARYRLRTPDAIQVATALTAGCEAFLTNDRDLRRVTELRTLLLDDLEL